jgi:hypothetical protein
MDMKHGHAARTFICRRTAWICMSMQHGYEWQCSMNIQQGHATSTFNMDMQLGHAARTCYQYVLQGYKHGHAPSTCRKLSWIWNQDLFSIVQEACFSL